MKNCKRMWILNKCTGCDNVIVIHFMFLKTFKYIRKCRPRQNLSCILFKYNSIGLMCNLYLFGELLFT